MTSNERAAARQAITARIQREAANRPARIVHPFVPNGLTIETAEDPAELLGIGKYAGSWGTDRPGTALRFNAAGDPVLVPVTKT